MGTTLQIERDGTELVGATELVESPDDGGFYLSQADFRGRRNRVSVRVWGTARAARADLARGLVEWEPWH